MLGQPFGMPIAGVAPSVSGAAGHPVRGMGTYASPAGLPFRRQSSGLTVGPGGGYGAAGAGGALGGAGAAGVPPVAFGQAALDPLGTPHLVGRALYGDGSAGNPFSTLGPHVHKIMASRAVVSWGTPRLGCGR